MYRKTLSAETTIIMRKDILIIELYFVITYSLFIVNHQLNYNFGIGCVLQALILISKYTSDYIPNSLTIY